MVYTIKDYSVRDLQDILTGTWKIIATQWELSWLSPDLAEVVAFLIHTL